MIFMMDGSLGIDKRRLSAFSEQKETVFCFPFSLPPHFTVLRF